MRVLVLRLEVVDREPRNDGMADRDVVVLEVDGSVQEEPFSVSVPPSPPGFVLFNWKRREFIRELFAKVGMPQAAELPRINDVVHAYFRGESISFPVTIV